jgi:two-component system, LytTR family, sensor kinase
MNSNSYIATTEKLPANKPKFDWFFKYKLYHIPFWFAYHWMWWVLTIGSFSQVTHNFFSPYGIKTLFYILFQALGVYFNLYYLIPKFLEKGKYVLYIFLLISVIIVMAACIASGYYVSSWLSGTAFSDLYGIDPKRYTYFFQVNTLPSTAASMTLGMSVKLAKNWIQTRNREQLLEKEKLETELNFLKYQFNPHFLFNSINSIFFLIHKNPDMASASLAKFSDLLRYQLYECNDKQILLSKEITCLENAIELEKLRQNDNVTVTFDVDEQKAERLGIAPFMLMTFVENAFKHVSKHTDKPNWIKIALDTNDGQLHFAVSNSTSHNAFTDVIRYGGIGLKNVQRRLDLMYPGKYNLDIQSNQFSFSITLQLQLSTMEAVSPMQKIA